MCRRLRPQPNYTPKSPATIPILVPLMPNQNTLDSFQFGGFVFGTEMKREGLRKWNEEASACPSNRFRCGARLLELYLISPTSRMARTSGLQCHIRPSFPSPLTKLTKPQSGTRYCCFFAWPRPAIAMSPSECRWLGPQRCHPE